MLKIYSCLYAQGMISSAKYWIQVNLVPGKQPTCCITALDPIYFWFISQYGRKNSNKSIETCIKMWVLWLHTTFAESEALGIVPTDLCLNKSSQWFWCEVWEPLIEFSVFQPPLNYHLRSFLKWALLYHILFKTSLAILCQLYSIPSCKNQKCL